MIEVILAKVILALILTTALVSLFNYKCRCMKIASKKSLLYVELVKLLQQQFVSTLEIRCIIMYFYSTTSNFLWQPITR